MRYLIDQANEYGLPQIVEQAMSHTAVHGVIIDIHPLWLKMNQLLQQGYPFDISLDMLDHYYYYARNTLHRWSDLYPLFTHQHPNDEHISALEKFWRERYNRNSLLVKILLRPGTKQIKITYEGMMTVVQENRSVPKLAVNPKAMTRPLMGGLSIGHAVNLAGTLGGILESDNGKRYGLTCGHVVDAVGLNVQQPSLHDGTPMLIGHAVECKVPVPSNGVKCNAYNPLVLNQVDVSLIELDASISSAYEILGIGKVDGFMPNNQMQPNTVVEYTGRTSGYQSLVIGGIGVIQELNDTAGRICCFKELIEIRQPSITSLVLNRPVKGGDSGAWLIAQGTFGNEWCGMIVGEERQIGYAMLAESILDFFRFQGYNLKCC